MLSIIFSILAGVLLPLAFSPFNIYTLAFISPALLLYAWLKASPGKAFLCGWLFGVGFFGIGITWIYISIHTYGDVMPWLAFLITASLVAIMALFPATQGYLLKIFFRGKSFNAICLAAFPASWVLWEWLRAWLFTGFPWLFLGYSQILTPLRGLAPLVGVYGVSLAVCLISGVLVTLAIPNTKKLKFATLLLMLVLLTTGWLMSGVKWTKSIKDLQVSLIQGNISQSNKWQSSRLFQTLATYKRLTEQTRNSQLIIWPEAAIPAFPNQVSSYIEQISQEAKNHNSWLIFGIPISNQQETYFYNGLMMVGKDQGTYLKRHLVPFGEYTPLPFLFHSVMGQFNIPMSNFSPGPVRQELLKLDQVKIAPFICYEIAYPQQVLKIAKESGLIITLSDDSWFDQSIALAQHLQIAQLRALETGRYVLLASNTGITAIIDPMGRVIKSAPLAVEAVVTGNIQAMRGKTPLMYWHYIPILILIILLLFYASGSKAKPEETLTRV